MHLKLTYFFAWVAATSFVILAIVGVCWESFTLTDSTGGTRQARWAQRAVNSGPLEIASLGNSRAFLAQKILQHILNHTVTIDGVSIVPPCRTTRTLTESTSSLLLLTALTKADNSTFHNHNSLWNYLHGIVVGSPSGFLPRYTYPVEPDTEEDLFVGRLPNWPLFVKTNPCEKNNTQCWLGSGRVSALPFHGTVLLELLLQLQRRPQEGLPALSQHELHQLGYYWERIYENHAYLHTVVMRGCSNFTTTPCYNILHPWESLLEKSSSPLWKVALQPTIDRMTASNWTPAYDIPEEIQESHGYDDKIYKGMLFLNECLVNATEGLSEADDIKRESVLLERCQFAMLDVGYASALAQADRDLRTVGMWLSAQNVAVDGVSSLSWPLLLSRLQKWVKQNDYVMEILWQPSEHSFQSQYAIPSPPGIVASPYPTMSYARDATANNLMVFWQDWDGRARDNLPNSGMDQNVKEMAWQLLSHRGEKSFDCEDSYPLWSAGCSSASPEIDPRYNYFVGLGMSRNWETYAPFGQYLTNATIKLICSGNSNQDESSIESTCSWNMTRFQEVYAGTNYSLHLDECGTTSISTASILAHLLWDDFDFTSESPLPPIRNSWVITLITAELMIAFAVGLTCVLLSLNIVRRENHEINLFRDDLTQVDPLIQESERTDVEDDDGDDIMSSS